MIFIIKIIIDHALCTAPSFGKLDHGHLVNTVFSDGLYRPSGNRRAPFFMVYNFWHTR